MSSCWKATADLCRAGVAQNVLKNVTKLWVLCFAVLLSLQVRIEEQGQPMIHSTPAGLAVGQGDVFLQEAIIQSRNHLIWQLDPVDFVHKVLRAVDFFE